MDHLFHPLEKTSMGSYIYDVRLKIQNFNPPSPLVFVCPETGNPSPMVRPKQTTPSLNSAIALRQN